MTIDPMMFLLILVGVGVVVYFLTRNRGAAAAAPDEPLNGILHEVGDFQEFRGRDRFGNRISVKKAVPNGDTIIIT